MIVINEYVRHIVYGLLLLIFGLVCLGSSSNARADNMNQGEYYLKDKVVYIVHGYKAGPDDHWFKWLQKKIELYGGTANIISMPNSSNPDSQIWTSTLDDYIGNVDQNSIIIAHSLGGISVLRFLNARKDQKLGKLILVSSFEDKLSTIPALDEFMQSKGFDGENIKNMSKNRLVFVSDNDPYVPPMLTKSLADTLAADIYEIKGAGHFLEADGYARFSELLAAVLFE